jgi:hypothetical protein
MSLVDRLNELEDSSAHQGKADVEELIRTLLNERYSPQMMPYKGDIVDRLREQTENAVRLYPMLSYKCREIHWWSKWMIWILACGY